MAKTDFFFAVRKILLTQLLVVVFSSAVALGWFSLPVARSVLFGGMVAFLPNLFFASRLRNNEKATPRQIVRSVYIGETLKLTITAALFFLVIKIPGILFLPLLLGFVAVLIVFWFALLMGGP